MKRRIWKSHWAEKSIAALNRLFQGTLQFTTATMPHTHIIVRQFESSVNNCQHGPVVSGYDDEKFVASQLSNHTQLSTQLADKRIIWAAKKSKNCLDIRPRSLQCQTKQQVPKQRLFL